MRLFRHRNEGLDTVYKREAAKARLAPLLGAEAAQNSGVVKNGDWPEQPTPAETPVQETQVENLIKIKPD